jgi:predicted anti-sigma-YlaC factor YlaD
MECEKIREEISLFIDNELAGPDKERFEGHVSSCAECRQLLEETRQAITCVKKAEPVPLPIDFTIRLNERLDREAARTEERKNIFVLFP